MSWVSSIAAEEEVARFVAERWVDRRGRDWLRRVRADVLYDDYVGWSGRAVGDRLHARSFCAAMRRLGFDRPYGSRHWYGIGEPRPDETDAVR